MKHLKLLTLIVSVFVIFSCSNNKNAIPGNIVHNPNTAQGETDQSNLPVIEFEKIEHDFGKLIEGESVSYIFKFKNTGNRELIITQAKATCGCTVPKFPRYPIKPGESDEIMVTFNSEGKKGHNNKAITILANTQPPTTVLRIKATVK
jgi:hypothetical protein